MIKKFTDYIKDDKKAKEAIGDSHEELWANESIFIPPQISRKMTLRAVIILLNDALEKIGWEMVFKRKRIKNT